MSKKCEDPGETSRGCLWLVVLCLWWGGCFMSAQDGHDLQRRVELLEKAVYQYHSSE